MADPVVEYYNQNAEGEWHRLFVTPYRRIEFEVVHFYLSKYLPPKGRILDLGGGPGRYTISLAKQGYQMILADLSPKTVQYARRKIAAAGVGKGVEAVVVADARKLIGFDDNSFDAVLCMGPLYHLLKRSERIQCLQECARVMKPNAPLFITVIPRFTFLRDALRSGDFEEVTKKNLSVLDDIFERGISPQSQIPNLYFCRPEEISEWLEEAGLEPLEIASTHGFTSFMDEPINALSRNAEDWNSLIKLVLTTCTDPSSFSAAEHLIGIARKSLSASIRSRDTKLKVEISRRKGIDDHS